MVILGGLSGDAVHASFKCSKCNSFFWRSSQLSAHLKKAHNVSTLDSWGDYMGELRY